VKTSTIGWTDFSGGDLNFITGCTPVSEGCAHCYARAIYERFGRDFAKVTCHEDKLERLRKVRVPKYSPKRGAPHKPMAFVVDMGDLFHEAVPAEFILRALDTLVTGHAIKQVLTKRAVRMRDMVTMWCDMHGFEVYPESVWFGITVENAQRLEERYPYLELTPAKTKFLSIEPMLEPMAEAPYMASALDTVDWVICGAESGPNRRSFDVQWAVDLYEVCQSNCKPFFGKQTSGLYPGEPLVLGEYGVVHEWPEN